MMSTTHARVSVVIATHRRPDYLREAVASVLRQSYSDFELIVVADGPDTATEAVLQEIDTSARVIRQPNLGRAAARNTGVDASSGELIAFLDDDDVWLPPKLERQVRFLDEHPEVCLAHTFTEIITGAGQRDDAATTDRLAEHRRAARLGSDYDALARYCVMFLSTVLVRRAALDRRPVFDPAIPAAEDWDLYLHIAQRRAIAVLPQPLVRYRVHATNTSNREHAEGRILTATKHLRRHAEGDASLSRTARALLHRHVAQAAWIQGDFASCLAAARCALLLDPSLALTTRTAVHALGSLLPHSVRDRVRQSLNRRTAAATDAGVT